MSRVALRRIYRQIPELECRGKCQSSCGPIAMSRTEADRIEARLGHPIGLVNEELTCPLLTAEGKCSVHDIRPLICRLWGAAKYMECPHGCRPKRYVTVEEGQELIAQIDRMDDRPLVLTTEDPVIVRGITTAREGRK